VVVESFLAAIGDARDLRRAFPTDVNVPVLVRSALDDMFRRGVWEALYAAHPNAPGFFTFSRVGFDASGAQALVYMAHSYGNPGGVGQFIRLTRAGASWMIANRCTVWMS